MQDDDFAGSNSAYVVVHHGDPNKSAFFDVFPRVVLSVTGTGFHNQVGLFFSLPDCDGTAYIQLPSTGPGTREIDSLLGLPKISMLNDPELGAIAYVPVDPAYPLQDGVEYLSRQMQGTTPCENNGGVSTLNGATVVESIELGFFPNYQISD